MDRRSVYESNGNRVFLLEEGNRLASRTRIVLINDISKRRDEKYDITCVDKSTKKNIQTHTLSRQFIGSNLLSCADSIEKNPTIPLRDIEATIRERLVDKDEKGQPVWIVTSIEADERSAQYFRSYIESAATGTVIVQQGNYKYVPDIMPNKETSEKPYLIGTVSEVADGDTFTVIVHEVKNVGPIGNRTKVGESKRIRMTGINSAELYKDTDTSENLQDAKNKNTEWLLNNNFTASEENLGKMQSYAMEAKAFLSETINGKKVTIFVDDYEDVSGYGKGFDMYGRILGVVYISDASGKDEAINVNKSLLANESVTFPGYPLAEPYYLINDSGDFKSNFPVASWWQYVVPEYKELMTGPERKEETPDERRDRFLKENGLKLDSSGDLWYNGKNISEVETLTPNSNEIPAGSETEDYVDSKHDDRDKLDGIPPRSDEVSRQLYKKGFTRIGDCLFSIPPLSISILSQSSIQQTPALRSKFNIQTKTGYALRTIRMTLYFSNEEQINGTLYTSKDLSFLKPSDTTPDVSYYRNGLRPLIAQFKSAPFLPIENELLNETHNIYSVAFASLNVSTIPGIPGALKAELDMYEFDHLCYMPQEEWFEGAFNWKLFRWNYQRFLQEPPENRSDRTWLKPIDTLDGRIRFFIPDEDALMQRKSAIDQFKSYIHPDTVEAANTEDGVSAEIAEDTKKLQKGQDQYLKFKTWLDKHPKSEYSGMFNDNGIFDPSRIPRVVKTPKFDGNEITTDEVSEQNIVKYGKAFIAMLETTYKSMLDIEKSRAGADATVEMVFMPNSMDIIIAITKEYLLKYSDYKKNTGSIYTLLYDVQGTTLKCYLVEKESLKYYDGTILGFLMKKKFDWENWNREIIYSLAESEGGAYVLKLKNESNLEIFDRDDFVSEHAIDPSKEYLMSGKDYVKILTSDILKINAIKERGNGLEDAFDAYRAKYEKLFALTGITEEQLPMVEKIIDGTIVTNIVANIQNNYAIAQLQANETPTLQFLGSQDASIRIEIKTKSLKTVKDFHELVSTLNRFSRDYRVAITSGILKIDNNILSILGISDTLIQSIQVATPSAMDQNSPDKESYIITLDVVGFNKTQRARETLDRTDSYSMVSNNDQDMVDKVASYSEKKRTEEGFEYALIDLNLRQLEVYPDLDLPTYEEVNEALKYLNIKTEDDKPFLELPNHGVGKFVDPDFYIRTTQTMRDYYQFILEKETPSLYLKDAMGFEAIEWGPSKGTQPMPYPNVWVSDETKEWLAENEPTQEEIDAANIVAPTEQANAAIANTSQVVDESDSEHGSYTDKAKNASSEPMVLSSFYVSEMSDSAITYASKKPTEEDYSKWYRRSSIGPDRIKAPSADQVHKKIINLVKYHWEAFPDQIDEIEDYDDDLTTYKYGMLRISAPEITQQKVVNTLKSVFEVESGWKQFSDTNNKPIYNESKRKIGISGISIDCGVFENKYDLKRAGWDWNYNIEKGVDYFAYCYKKAVNSANEDAKGNPLDWAVLFYGNRNLLVEELKAQRLKKVSSNTLDDNFYYRSVSNVLRSKYGADPKYFHASPEKLVEETTISLEDAQDAIENIIDNTIYKAKALDSLNIFNMSEKQWLEDALEKKNIKGLGAYSYSLVLEKSFLSRYSPKGTHLSLNTSSSIKRGASDEEVEKMFARPTDDLISLAKKNNKTLFPSSFLPITIVDPSDLIEVSKESKQLLEERYSYKKLNSLNTPLLDLIIRDLYKRFAIGDPNYNPFDYSVNVVFIKSTAIAEMLKVYSYGNKDEPVDIHKQYSKIKWGNIYSLVNIEEDLEELQSIVINMKTAVASNVKTINPDDPSILFQDSFVDAKMYDQRGRLVRAFPTFQMFIIEEGRWFAWQKLWDRFYGYNSLISIDVMKDRRMPSDTAIVSMSNVYGSLTNEDDRVSFGEWDYSLLDLFADPSTRLKEFKAILGLPDAEIIRAHRETVGSMILAPGARISLRIGYGANAYQLPNIFNGTITELTPGEIVTIVAQGDGVELTNKLHVKPDETTENWVCAKEPREVICEMLTSKGGFFKNFINKNSNGVFFSGNPLGISHFGTSVVPDALLSPDFGGLTDEYKYYGEAGLNIYTGSNINSMSQWVYTDGPRAGQPIGWHWWDGTIRPPGDAPNIEVYLFDQTPWDVVNLYASACTDYIAAVHPFEYRSTLYFGRPWWRMTYGYRYRYEWDDKLGALIKKPVGLKKKTYSQFRFYFSETDIINNNITASAENMYTNVIGAYDEQGGTKTTGIVQVDSDIYPDKQTTAVVRIPIKNSMTSEKYATSVATSALKNYVKEMYQGDLVILGDPTAKPHDTVYIADSLNDMSGSVEIRRVVHHFSIDTGFVTSITPDAVVIIDDDQGASIKQWGHSFFIGAMGTMFGGMTANKLWKTIGASPMGALLRQKGKDASDYILKKILIDNVTNPAYKEMLEELKPATIREFIYACAEDPAEDILSNAGKLRNAMKKSGVIDNKTALKLGDEVVEVLGKALHPFVEGYKNPANIGKLVDDLWDSVPFLKNGLPSVRQMGFFGKSVDAVTRFATRVFKGVIKPTGKITATAARGLIGVIKSPLFKAHIVPALIAIGMTIITEGIIEKARRYLKSRQAVTIYPLMYKGSSFVAGINGHRGSVYGDTPSKIDRFLMGEGSFGGLISFTGEFLDIKPDYYPTGPEQVARDKYVEESSASGGGSSGVTAPIVSADGDTKLLARIIYAEAGGEPYEGMKAVGTVIMNRVADSRFPNTIREVIFAKGQFDPVKNGGNAKFNGEPSAEALNAATEVINGYRSFGAEVVYFYNPRTSTDGWIVRNTVTVKMIGGHAFAKSK